MQTARERLLAQAAKPYEEREAHPNAAKIAEIREKVQNGEIDAGPPTEHTGDIRDRRDNRDPAVIGNRIFAARNGKAPSQYVDQITAERP